MIVRNYGSCCRSKMSGFGADPTVTDPVLDPTGKQTYSFFKLIGALTIAGVATNVISNILERKKR